MRERVTQDCHYGVRKTSTPPRQRRRRVGCGGRWSRLRRSLVWLGLLGMIGGCGMEERTMGGQASSAGPAPRNDAWRVIGPGGGGTMIGPTISPHDPNLVVEHCDMTGAYITTDGGLSWRIFNLRGVANTFAFDPGDAKVIYAGNYALWRSEDGGKTWSMVLPDPSRNTVEHQVGDHAGSHLTSEDPNYPSPGFNIQAIAVGPTDSKQVYVAAGGRRAGLYLSQDRGKSWSCIQEFERERVHALRVEAGASGGAREIYVVASGGVHRERGGEWQHLPGPGGDQIQAASIGKAEGSSDLLIYATTRAEWEGKELSGGVHVSRDGGETWRDCNGWVVKAVQNPGEGRPPSFRAIACSAENARTAYVGFQGLQLEAGGEAERRRRQREGRYNGIAKTTDGGDTWRIVHKESVRPSDNMEVSWIEGRAPEGGWNIWFDAPYSLGAAPTNPDVCYATDLFRTYRTLDGGRSWQQVNSVRVGEDRWTTRGLDVTTCYGVHFDPFDVKHVFITYTDIGMFQSSDGGASWIGSTEGIPNHWRNTTYWIEMDPAVEGLVWGVFAGPHDLPRPKMWRGRNVGRYTGGVAVSSDGGRTWALSNEGMGETAATHILMDPTSPVGKRVLYVCGFGRGVYKSVDNGKTWALKNNGIEGEQPFAWRLTRADDGTLYLVVARQREEEEEGIGDDGNGALYRSRDGAETWVKMNLPAGCNGPNGLTLDPRDNRRMYLAAWGRYAPEGDVGGGVFLSTDGGETWRNIFGGSQHVYDVTVDSQNPDVLYICGFNSGAYRSDDRGETWKRIKGYNFKWGHRVIPDPVEAEKIYITTFGGSVWHGPATGDPEAPEDIVTPVPTSWPVDR
jgi:photosystem II stability/assembly factor-like uncharacterized protein